MFCGFGGDDGMLTGLVLLDAGDIFLGGDGNDEVGFNFGTFNGGEEGTDTVVTNEQRHLRAVIINPSSNQGGAGAATLRPFCLPLFTQRRGR